MDFATAVQALCAAIGAAAQAHREGNLDGVADGFDDLDAILPRVSDPSFDQVFIAFHFWDGWIDSRNHDWQQYPGIAENDWPNLADSVVASLKAHRPISDQRILNLFDFRKG